MSVNHGVNQTFTITPNTGYFVSNIVVDGSSVGAASSYTFSNVTSAHTISATFSVRTYTLTASAGTGGTISPTGSVTINHGASQTFTITPSTGYTIANVQVDGSSIGAVSSYRFRNVTGNHTISATFTTNTYTISATAGTGGTISPSGNVTVSHGNSQTFTITPAIGYTISNVLVDGVSQGAVGIYSFGNVMANHTISASFIQITYTIQASAASGGTISPSGTVTVAQGTNQTFTILADSGYVVSDVLVDGSSVGAVSSYTFANVTSSHVISASFVEGYTLAVTTTGNGSGTITPSLTGPAYPPGTKVTLRATRDVSSVFEGFSGDCTSTRTSCTITLNKNATVSAAFKLKTLKIKATVEGNGSVSLEQSDAMQKGMIELKPDKSSKDKKSKHESEIDYGNQIVYTITPEPGNYIKNVSVDRKSQGSVDSLTLTDVKRNHTVVVRFEPEEGVHSRNGHLIKSQIILEDDDDSGEQQALTDLLEDSEKSPTTNINRFVSVRQ